MCGRFTLIVTVEELVERFGLEEAPLSYVPRFNAAPGQMVLAIVAKGGKRHGGMLKWGLVPSWAKDEKIGYKMINAKAETLTEKPSFRTAFERRRCIIPADGFYEWRRQDAGKQPMRIVRKDRELFALAGLYDTWTAPDGRRVGSCTVVTTEPNELVRDIHDRMPVILRPEGEELWLDRDVTDPSLLQPLLVPYPAEAMSAYPVDPKVGNVKNDTADCVEPYAWR
ncbi:SOS response-associated peptidase [Paenibacillus aurantius]|uniref:Abasic site processing protein n=1 Tax=Paenibacillus aurantius TaxID=2918900 RepID=A0AA96LI74_9BACL|nr:SOS response-associated peptidase [Paenibacillus aurantius]WNQ12421.1 SOS response-associated peptidase [Paenibacillus aurantius]